MKRIGILGGLGPESTVDYYKEIIAAFNHQYRELAYPEIIIYSVNMNAVMKLVECEDWRALSKLLVEKIEMLHRAGAEFAAIASNTPHVVFDEVNARSPLPLLSIVEETCNRAQEMGLRKTALLGTALTMKSDFYKEPFLSRGISVEVPSKDEQELIHHKLFSEIELGIIKDSTREELLAIIKRMVEENQVDSVVLGCTELPLILTESTGGIPFLNTTAIHCEAILKCCVAGQVG
jgi:aspartate racemase